MTELKTLFQLFNNLSESEKKAFLRKVKGENPTTQSKSRITCNCAYCKSQHIVKFGKSDKGDQRYLCKDCNKTFTAKTNTILYKSPYSEKVWRKYINCMMQGMSIRKSAKECGINADTAFKWRHKILDSLQAMHDEVKLDGVVEADETFFALSFKGNHKKSNFNLPRESHHRGKCTHTRGISSEQVCVPCAINLNGLSKSVITNLGKPTVKDLRKVFSRSIVENSVLVTDRNSAYNKIASEHNLQLVQIKSGKGSKGTFNIAKINSYHSILKMFIIYNFRGVATNYLNNYLIWNNIKNYSLGSVEDKKQIFADFVFTNRFSEKSHDVSKRAAVPI